MGEQQDTAHTHGAPMPGPVVILGGHGQIGQILTRQLVEKGWPVRSVIRKGRQVQDIEALGAEAVIFDLEAMNTPDLAQVLRGASAVVFAAGAGPGSETRRKRTVDYGASVLAQRAAMEAGVSRFIQISAYGLQFAPGEDEPETWREYVRAKRDADLELSESTLNWTIVRPTRLTNEPGRGTIAAALDFFAEEHPLPISRTDVASVIVVLLQSGMLRRQSVDIAGGATPIRQALGNLV